MTRRIQPLHSKREVRKEPPLTDSGRWKQAQAIGTGGETEAYPSSAEGCNTVELSYSQPCSGPDHGTALPWVPQPWSFTHAGGFKFSSFASYLLCDLWHVTSPLSASLSAHVNGVKWESEQEPGLAEQVVNKCWRFPFPDFSSCPTSSFFFKAASVTPGPL